MAVNPSSLDYFVEAEALLKSRGYTLGRRLGDGEGHTADVFEAEYRSGSLCQTRVVKIPKSEIDPASVTTLINLSKGDLDERAILAQNKISHPNIIQNYDAFKLGERTITVEENFDALSLELLVRMGGPITDPLRFERIFTQVISGLSHLHSVEGLLHRDIKPSNILINRHNNHVKVCDLQNVGVLDEIPRDVILPTRGGTAYTEPSILNALMEGNPIRYDLASELYALGATMYYVLTGEKLNQVTLKPGPGRKIQVGEAELQVMLEKDGHAVKEIDLAAHQKELERKIKNVPSGYRKMLRYCLIEQGRVDHHPYIVDAQLESLLEEATSKRWSIPFRKIGQYLGWYVGVAAVLTGLIGGSYWINSESERKAKLDPTALQLLSASMFGDGRLDVLLQEPSKSTLDYLAPTFKYLVEHRAEIESLQEKNEGSIERHYRFEGVSKRLLQPLIISAALPSDEEVLAEYQGTRDLDTLVPLEFVISWSSSRKELGVGGVNPYQMHDLEKTGYATKYLRYCVGTNSSIADVFAGYFSSSLEEVFKARMAAGSYNYYPRTEPHEEFQMDPQTFVIKSVPGERVVPGYSSQLSPLRKRLIDQAIALYLITDNEGNIHWETLDDTYRPISGLDAK